MGDLNYESVDRMVQSLSRSTFQMGRVHNPPISCSNTKVQDIVLGTCLADMVQCLTKQTMGESFILAHSRRAESIVTGKSWQQKIVWKQRETSTGFPCVFVSGPQIMD